MVEVQTGLGGGDWVSGANLELDRDRRRCARFRVRCSSWGQFDVLTKLGGGGARLRGLDWLGRWGLGLSG